AFVSGSFRAAELAGLLRMEGLHDLVDASPGGWSGYNCAVRASGQVVCWDPPHFSKGAWDRPLAPRDVPGLTNIRAIASTSNAACALSVGDQVACWGRPGAGILGSGTSDVHPIPIEVSRAPGARRIAAGRSRTCAHLSDG